MIMMRSTPATKTAKPPPPVPPRPSKMLIAEALAKSKKAPTEPTPLRMAPPPPVAPEGVTKSKSHSAVNVVLKKPNLERTISEEVKSTSRTVVFESSNMKCSKIQVNLSSDSNGLAKSADKFENSSSKSSEEVSTSKCASSDDSANKLDKNWNEILNNRNHVNTLIDEMFASVLEIPDDTVLEANNENVNYHTDKVPNDHISDDRSDSSMVTDKEKDDCKPTVLVINQQENEAEPKATTRESKSNSSTGERKHVKFDDKMNHELLISELQNMKKEQERILKRQRKPSQEIYEDVPGIYHSDWVEVNNGEEVRLSSCQITIEDFKNKENADGSIDNIVSRLAAMSSLHGLPPLPKSLSGFSLQEDLCQTPTRPGSSRGPTPPVGHHVYPPHMKPTVNGTDAPSGRPATNLDSQLAILRREMVSLFCDFVYF